LSAATKARQVANNSSARHKPNVSGPETLSADDELSTSSAFPAAMLAEDDDRGDGCRTAAPLVDNNAAEMTSLLAQPITRQSDESDHDGDVAVADAPKYVMTSSEYVYLCPLTDDGATHSTD